MIDVTPAAISQYENGPQSPRPDVLDRIVDKLGFPRNFFLRSTTLDGTAPIFWRSNATATQSARDRSLQRLRWLKEISSYLNDYLDLPKLDLPVFRIPDDFRQLRYAEIEKFAQECRDWWSFGSDQFQIFFSSWKTAAP
jgi:transcriptional regulator with XRE-family HTH domain